MPITPFQGAVDSAIRMMSAPPLWLAIGRTTPWEDENNPPNENDFEGNPQYINMIQPEELIGFKRVEVTQLAVPDITGEVRYRNQRYALIDTNDDAVQQVARWLYIRATLDYVERNTANQSIIGFVTFRQTCLMSGIIPLPAYDGEIVLAPEQVEHFPNDPALPENLRGAVKGRLVFLANHKPRTRDGAMRDIFEIIREFRS